MPAEAFEGLRLESRRAPALVAAACSRMQPDFAFVSASEVWAAEAVDKIGECGVAAVWAVGGPFGRVAAREGWSETLRDTAARPSELSGKLYAEMPVILEEIRRGVRLGVAAIAIADDLAGSQGPLMPPDFILDELMPKYSAFAEEAALGAVPSVFHSDGDMRPFVPALRRAGFWAVHSGGLAPEAFEALLELARGHELRVIGGLSSATLDAGGPQVMKRAMRVAAMAADGGLLVADDGGIVNSEQVAWLVTALQTVRDFDRMGSE
ncbi:MAG: hypothetical protein ACYC6C_08645 [Coriobacteriia bacterium]